MRIEEPGPRDLLVITAGGGFRESLHGDVAQAGEQPRVGVLEVGLVEGVARVDHHVATRVQRVGVDHRETVRVRIVALARHQHRLPGPLHGHPRDHAGHQPVRAGVAEEHQVVRGDHLVVDLGVLDHADPAPQPLVEFPAEAAESPVGPVGLRLRPGGPAACDTDKRLHEGVVDRTLQVATLVQIEVLLEGPRRVVVQHVPVLAVLLVEDARQQPARGGGQAVLDSVDLNPLGDIPTHLQRGDVACADSQGPVRAPGRLHHRRPVQLLHLLDRQPLANVVLDGPGHEADIDAARVSSASLVRVLVVKSHELLERLGMEPVAGPRPDQQLDRHAQPLGPLDHRCACQQLLVDFPAVGTDRDVVSVQGVGNDIVDRERAVLVSGSLLGLVLVLVEVDEPGPGSHRRPAAGMVQPEMPRAGSSHREPPESDPAVVDADASLEIRKSLEYVRLTGVPVGVVGAAEHVQLHKRLPLGQCLALVQSDEP